MKPQETMQNTQLSQDLVDDMGDNHFSSSVETPMVKDAFSLDDAEKKRVISYHFSEIMKTLGLDLEDDSLRGSPDRVAKMYIDEIFSGLNPKNKPKVSLFENKYQYNEMLVEKDISFYSNCEHHFVPIIGKAHVAYKSNGKVIGLSKINRIVDYFSKRPQVQERLTRQIALELTKILDTEDVAVLIYAKHLCVASRGIKDDTSETFSAYYGGEFKNENTKNELFAALQNC
ncbi:MAG: GTP cyclohydrolase I FolE [Flavobacteriales bacterium]|nr:GTP cyclohydrolase I FolE [Flavobacteriales bacterium]